METRLIEVSVRGQEISCTVQHPYPRTNTVQYLHVHFDADAIWDPLKKIAVFRRSGTATVAVPLDETMMCEMPPQMMAVPGYSGPVTVHIGLIGVGENGGRLTTGEVPVTVNPSCYTAGKTPHPPAPDVYEELLRLIREAAENDAEEIRAALDAYFAENPLDVSGKLDKNQGAENAGKVLGIGEDGMVVPMDDLIPDDIVTSVNGQTGDVQTRLMVTITANEDGTYTSSHTSQEIYAASQAGAVVEASNVNGARYSLYLCSEQFVQFLVMSVSGGSGNRSLNTRTFVINGDKVINANTQTPIPVAPSNMVGATETAAGTAGLVPAPAAGDGGKFLRGDGTWGEIDMPEGGSGGFAETDPTVPVWAKQPEKPSYTADEVGAVSQDQLEEAVNQALSEAKASGEFDGKDGEPGVYVGSGDMPEGYNVQIDPNGDAFTVDDLIPEKPTPMVGATETEAGTAGLVPAPAAGDEGKFLRGDGTWGEFDIPEGGGGGTQLLIDYTAEEEVLNDTITYLEFLTDKDGNALSAKNILFCFTGTITNDQDDDFSIRLNINDKSLFVRVWKKNEKSSIFAMASINENGCIAAQYREYASKQIVETVLETNAKTIQKIGIGSNNYFKTHLAAGSNIKVWGW